MMTIQGLKNYLSDLKLEEELEKLLFEMIDQTGKVNPTLLNTIADILDLQADFYEKSAEVHEQEAEMFEGFAKELQNLDDEEMEEKLKIMQEEQQKIVDAINQKVEEIKQKAQTQNSDTGMPSPSAVSTQSDVSDSGSLPSESQSNNSEPGQVEQPHSEQSYNNQY